MRRPPTTRETRVNTADILALRPHELEELLREGHRIDPAQLDDLEFRGTSLGLPSWVERLTWKKFKKVFHRDPRSGHLRGWNVRVEQGESWRAQRRRDGSPKTFGHYRVVDGERIPRPPPWGEALLIDYGRGQNSTVDPLRFLRDPIVSLDPGRVDRLLGWSYVDLGRWQVGTPSYFLLEKDGPLTHTAVPPRS